MDIEKINLKLNDHDHEIGSLKHRMQKMENCQSDIQKLTLSVDKLATNMQYMLQEQKEQSTRISALEKEPLENAKYYKRTIITSILTGVVGTIIGALLMLILK